MEKSLVIGVFSAKGGVGKSLVASNLGAAFAGLHKLPTALIDLSPGLGNADLLLDVEPERTWADLLPVMEGLNARHLELAVTEHASGLRLLAAHVLTEARLARSPMGAVPLASELFVVYFNLFLMGAILEETFR